MNKIIKIASTSIIAILLSACGDSNRNDIYELPETTTNKPKSETQISLNKIEEYAKTDGKSEKPTIQDYKNIGILEIDTEEKLKKINESVSKLKKEDINTKDKVFALKEKLGIVTTLPINEKPKEEIKDKIAPIISIGGSKTISLNIGDTYTEQGASATDNKDSSVEVIKSGYVNTSKAGTYTITYTATDKAGNSSTETRTVVVSVVPVKDTTNPVITLAGSSQLSLKVGDTYTEQGASASDNKDGIITVKTSGHVDTTEHGTYLITYTATDRAGNTATKTRTIEVNEVSTSDNPNIYNKSLSTYSFIGTGYGKLTKPSTPAPGVQKPYVPDLSHISESDIIYVSPDGSGNGNSESSPANFKETLESGSAIDGKTIIALDGEYDLSSSSYPYIKLDHIENVNLISKNKHGAKLILDDSRREYFTVPTENSNVHNFSIIGFESHPKIPKNGVNKVFFRNVGTHPTTFTYNIYFSDMKFSGYGTVIYSGLHSHDWTVDKCEDYDNTYEYLWYMMGWHHSVINSVMYNNRYSSLSIRGSYPQGEEFDWRDNAKDNGINKRISSRSKHFLSKNDWTHLIMNNTFGSTYNYSVPEHTSSEAHIVIYYDKNEGKYISEDVYFPPRNILIANNIFMDGGDFNKDSIEILANRGINTDNIESINGIKIINNYTDRKSIIQHGSDGDKSQMLIRNSEDNSIGDFGFGGFYELTSDSILKDVGYMTDIWVSNSDFLGNTRDADVDVGAFEYIK